MCFWLGSWTSISQYRCKQLTWLLLQRLLQSFRLGADHEPEGGGIAANRVSTRKGLDFHRGIGRSPESVNQPATILDIADRAGVSHGTVSRVLNAKYIRCKEQTRQKILRIAAELNYQPNSSARSLKTRSYKTIGFVSYDITDAFVVDCIGAIEEYLASTEYRALWLSARFHTAETGSDLFTTLRGLPIDGLIVLESNLLISDVELLTLHVRDRMRICTLARKIEGGHISSVTLDNVIGIKQMAGHLIDHGHREIAFLWDVKNHPGAVARFETFKRILTEKQLPIRNEWFVPTDGTIEGGYRAARKLLSQRKLPTAIIAYNDLSAFGCIRACVKLGSSVPQDISVAGFDDIRIAARYNPSLTTIASDYRSLAQATVRQMISLIEADWELFRVNHVVIEPKLVIRESTAPPPR